MTEAEICQETPREQCIKELKAHFEHEIMLSVTELDEAMYIAMISFAFPVGILVRYIYAKLTGIRYVFWMTQLLDLLITTLVGIWFYRFEVYIHAENEGFGIEPPH